MRWDAPMDQKTEHKRQKTKARISRRREPTQDVTSTQDGIADRDSIVAAGRPQ